MNAPIFVRNGDWPCDSCKTTAEYESDSFFVADTPEMRRVQADYKAGKYQDKLPALDLRRICQPCSEKI